MISQGQRFDACIFAALDVADAGQADAIAREFPALWAAWAQGPAPDTGTAMRRAVKLRDPRLPVAVQREQARVAAESHPPWCDLLSAHRPPFECEPAVPFPPGLDPSEIHHHSENGPAGCPRCDLARQFPLEAARAIEDRKAAEPHVHAANGPATCAHCRVVRDAERQTVESRGGCDRERCRFPFGAHAVTCQVMS